jgi:putative transcriptional regulator
MTPAHHPDAGLLVERATTALPAALDVLVASHLTLCPSCRALEAQLDAVGGALLASEAPSGLPADALAATLARLDAPAPSAPVRGDPVLPLPILAHTGPFASVPWTRQLFGCRRYDLPVALEGRAARLLCFPPGWALPEHAHEAVEYSLVLTGGYTDETGHFARGDVGVHAPDTTHRPVIDPGEPCVVLLVHAGRLVPRSWWSRPATWFIDGA